MPLLAWRSSCSVWVLLLLAGCERQERPEQTNFYQRRIGPILEQSCVDGPAKAGCHVRADELGNALGNLSLQSYDDLVKRRDLLIDYGPYGMPGMLLKAVPPFKLALTSWKSSEPLIIDSNIAHVGGSLIDITSSSFTQLQAWMENGAAANNARQADRKYEQGDCTTTLGTDPAFDPTVEPDAPDYTTFASKVSAVLGSSCAASNCHGSPANSLYLTCGETPEQQRWNYFAAQDYVSSDPPLSEIVRRPLAPSAGGTFHEGGVVFASTGAPEYTAVLDWATEKGGPTNVPDSAGFEFFADRVQPLLVRRGCMMLGCHSSAMFHDYRLRGGSGGHFGLPATRKNYELTLEQIALESQRPEASRLVRKNLIPAPAGPGILHRGGALFADGPATCDDVAARTGPLDEQSEYCVVSAWIEMERAARMPASGLSGIVFVRRPPAPLPDTPQDYATFAPGAELVRVAVTEDAASAELTAGAEESLSELCGLAPATSDVRRPAVSWDASKIAFAARTSAAEPFAVYVIEGNSCAREPTIAARVVDDDGEAVPDNGELRHDFDPAFSPDGRLVFASTRGNTKNTSAFEYSGPQRTPADPSKLNANLYVVEGGKVRQLTFLLNQELSPSFMRDGRLLMTTEKRQPGFYQLAGRRMNLDGGDYHPLFGQRSTIGFNQFVDVVELSDKNLAAIVSDRGAAHGAGALALVNRSLGIDQRSADVADYTQDPAAITFPNPDFYQRSFRILDDAATGKLSGTQGAYRNPSPLPSGDVLVSYAANVVALDSFDGNFDIVTVNVSSGARTPLVGGDDDELWPVAIYPRPTTGAFRSRLDEANGATQILDDSERREVSDVTLMDVNLLSSLLFQNTRSGRPVVDGGQALQGVWESLPPVGITSFADAEPRFLASDDFGQVYVRRRLLGAPTVFGDGSAAMRLRGGVPITLQVFAKLAGESASTLHFQREEMQFYPGEVSRQGFRSELFDGLCGGCHGSISGMENEVAVNPDILTQASSVAAITATPTDLTNPVGSDEGP
jgi:WD40-like Beta Propeller Repeat